MQPIEQNVQLINKYQEMPKNKVATEQTSLKEKKKEPYKNVAYRPCKWCPLFKIQVQEWAHMANRVVHTNEPDHQVISNKITTCKYNLITFLPLNVLEQFSKVANIYFLVIGMLSMIDEITMSEGQPLIFVPLFFIVFVTAFKDLVEDLSRRRSDKEENQSMVWRVQATGQGIEEVFWQDLHIGDIVKIPQNQFFPADLLLLYSSDEKGQVYVETKNLDGETNMKHKKVVPACQKKYSSLQEHRLPNGQDTVHYEKPNPFIYNFQGLLEIDGVKLSVDQTQTVLRGCSLRNTDYVYGMVLYTGPHSKIMLNSVQARVKQSTMMVQMNSYIFLVVFLQLAFCAAAGLVHLLLRARSEQHMDYLHDDSPYSDLLLFLIKFGNWNIMFSYFMPISLYVSLEMVKYLQGQMIAKDPNMFSMAHQINTKVQTSSLNEELGQVQYIFSDKTGTLTKNVMEFKRLEIHGKMYGQAPEDILTSVQDVFDMPMPVDKVDFNDREFMRLINGQDGSQEYQRAREYLLQLGLCHTVIVSSSQGKLVYNASSPDEYALIQMAMYCGYQYQGIDKDNVMRIKDTRQNIILSYELLNVLEFSSARKRMSVILRDQQNQQIILYCKGADNIVHDRLHSTYQQNYGPTNYHLEQFAKVGLRTLVLGKRVVPEQEYQEWAKEYQAAQENLENKDQLMAEQQDKIEVDLELIGTTAIEDKLQDDVGPTISYIRRAGIRVWVLTGDKLETAINIGYSCQLLDDSLVKLIITEVDHQALHDKLSSTLKQLLKVEENIKYALVVSGDSLTQINTNELRDMLARVSDQCEVVVACRVSPKQKAEIVNLVKQYRKGAITLAIGDGANDVNMINAAHVGVGIMGVEGNQAARSSDYSMGEFQFLRRLLLVKGREFCRRNSQLIVFNFWKNMILTVPTFIYGFYNLFSGTQYYNALMLELYNITYTSMPIIYFALYDKQYPDEQLFSGPHLYEQGRKGLYFNYKLFSYWVFNGIFYSIGCILCLIYSVATPYNELGLVMNRDYVGLQLLFLVVLLANFKVLVMSHSTTLFQLLLNFFSNLSLIMVFYFTSLLPTSDHYYASKNNLFPSIFILIMFLVLGFSTIIDQSVQRYHYFASMVDNDESKRNELKRQKERKELRKRNTALIKSINKQILREIKKNEDEDMQQSYHQELERFKETVESMASRKALKDILQDTKSYKGYAFSQEENQLWKERELATKAQMIKEEEEWE